MYQLESPNELAGFAAQSHDGIGPLVVTGTQAAVVVGAGAAGGDKEQVTLTIHRHDGPCVACTAAPGSTLAFRSCRIGICGKRIPAPAKSARACIVGTHYAASHVHAMIVVNGGADDNEIVDDRGRGSHVIPARVVLEDIAKADYAVLAEVGAGRASGGVYSNKARVLSGLKDAAMAGLVFGTRSVEPSGDATIDETVTVVAVEIDLGVVGPALLPGFGIEGDDAIEGSGEIESPVHEERRRLKTAALSPAAGFR